MGAIRVGLRRGEVKRARAKPNVHASKVFTREGTAQFNTEGYAEDRLRRTRPWFYDIIRQENFNVP